MAYIKGFRNLHIIRVGYPVVYEWAGGIGEAKRVTYDTSTDAWNVMSDREDYIHCSSADTTKRGA